MSRYNFLDVSGYQQQAQNDSFWQSAKALGCQGAIVKLSEGTWYRNPYGWNQVASAKRVGMKVAGYHFAQFVGNSYQAVDEANYAIGTANSMGISRGSAIVLDYELRAGDRGSNTAACIAFCKTIKANGFQPAFYSYSGMANLWDYEAVYQATGAWLWIAAYPHMGATNDPDYSCFPSISTHVNGWQYTDDWHGWGVDGSVDLTGEFTMEQKITTAGHLDSKTFNRDQLTFSGWFASEKTKDKPYTYVIVVDEATKHEYGRHRVELTDRPDVAKAYPDIPNAGKSGFKATFTYTPDIAGKKLDVVFRYTDNEAGNGSSEDYWIPVAMDANVAYLDSSDITVYTNKLHVSGWFANDQTIGHQYRYVILYDQTTKKEVQRFKVTPVNRPDVAKVHPDVYGAGQSGFSCDFDYSRDLIGHDLIVVSRYSDDPKYGEGHYVDYWFVPFKGPNEPILDGKHAMSVVVHSFNAESTDNGLTKLTFK